MYKVPKGSTQLSDNQEVVARNTYKPPLPQRDNKPHPHQRGCVFATADFKVQVMHCLLPPTRL